MDKKDENGASWFRAEPFINAWGMGEVALH